MAREQRVVTSGFSLTSSSFLHHILSYSFDSFLQLGFAAFEDMDCSSFRFLFIGGSDSCSEPRFILSLVRHDIIDQCKASICTEIYNWFEDRSACGDRSYTSGALHRVNM